MKKKICGDWLNKFTNVNRNYNSRPNNFNDEYPIETLKEFYKDIEASNFDSQLSHLGKIVEKSIQEKIKK